MRDALFGHYHAYCCGGVTISTVVMDVESTAINIADMINGPWFQALASGVHYVIVDTRIRKIMEGMRSILS